MGNRSYEKSFLEDVAIEFGQDVSDKIRDAFGGRDLLLPKHKDFKRTHPLVDVVGYECARSIVKRFGL